MIYCCAEEKVGIHDFDVVVDVILFLLFAEKMPLGSCLCVFLQFSVPLIVPKKYQPYSCKNSGVSPFESNARAFFLFPRSQASIPAIGSSQMFRMLSIGFAW